LFAHGVNTIVPLPPQKLCGSLLEPQDGNSLAPSLPRAASIPASNSMPQKIGTIIALSRLHYLVMRRNFVLLLLVPALAAPAFADSLKDALNHQYKKHVIALRSPFAPGTHQKFDSSGKQLEPPQDQWLLYGGIFVEKIDLSSKNMRLEGPRIGFGQDKKGKQLLIAMEKRVQVDIELDQPLHSPDEAKALLERVFFPESETMQHAKPELRRADFNLASTAVYHVGKDQARRIEVKAPHPTYTPEPRFSDAARQARYQGTMMMDIVIDERGNLAWMRVVRALGMGLDENAMEMVRTWRFDPATRNGEPVPVEMQIEVSFNLY
jgi:TonB family protein